MSMRRMISTIPSGVTPVSNRSRWTDPSARVTSTRAEKPCSALGPSGTRPSRVVGAACQGQRARGRRRAGPASAARMSQTLSTIVVILSRSTGSRGIRSPV